MQIVNISLNQSVIKYFLVVQGSWTGSTVENFVITYFEASREVAVELKVVRSYKVSATCGRHRWKSFSWFKAFK